MNIVRLFIAGAEGGSAGDAAGRDGQHGDRSYPQHWGRWRDGGDGCGRTGRIWGARAAPGWCSPLSPFQPHIDAKGGWGAGGGSRAQQNLTGRCLLFYPASLYRSGASLKLMTSKFGVSNCCFRGFALSLYNSLVPEVMETRGERFTACLPSPKWLWKQDTLFSVSQ